MQCCINITAIARLKAQRFLTLKLRLAGHFKLGNYLFQGYEYLFIFSGAISYILSDKKFDDDVACC